MSLILAVEPDRRRAAQLASMARAHLDAEFILAHSVAQGFQALGERVPDILLTAPLLPPAEELALDDYLRLIGPAAAHVQSLTIPLLASQSSNGERGMLSPFRRDKQNLADAGGCEPAVFAEQIAGYLRELRKPASPPVPTAATAIDDPDDEMAVDLSALLDDDAPTDSRRGASGQPSTTMAALGLETPAAPTILPIEEPGPALPIEEAAPVFDPTEEFFLDPAPGEIGASSVCGEPGSISTVPNEQLPEPPSVPLDFVALEPAQEEILEPIAELAPELIADEDVWGTFEPVVLEEPAILNEPIVLADLTDIAPDEAPALIAAEPPVLVPEAAPTPSVDVFARQQESPIASVPPPIVEPSVPSTVAMPEVLPAVAAMPSTQMVPRARPAMRPVAEPQPQPEPQELVPYAGAAQVPAPAAPNTVQQIIQVPTGNGTQVGASVSVAVAVSVQVAAAVNVAANAPSKRQKPRPVQDEWGFFDPGQCGFQALVARLDAIAAEEDKDNR